MWITGQNSSSRNKDSPQEDVVNTRNESLCRISEKKNKFILRKSLWKFVQLIWHSVADYGSD